jgi:HD-GYP domain-containing protein (c-di-GMP phosphodiesterase class II)
VLRTGIGAPSILCRGDHFLLGARIISVAAAIAARTEYAHEWSREHALNGAIRELMKHSNVIFDLRIVRALSSAALETI